MATPENKIEEFQDASAAIIGAAVEATERPAETLQNLFTVAHDEGTQRIQMNLVQQVWNGLTDPGQLSMRLNGADLIIIGNQVASMRARRASQDHLFLITLNNLHDQIAALGRDVDDAEKGFAERYGEAWREDLALKIVDKDLIPQRMDGESLEDYRERVEDVLMDELLDDKGEIKPEYKDHPEYGEFAEWAQKRHDLAEAQLVASHVEAVYNDPTATLEERGAALKTAEAQALDLIAANSDNDEAKLAAENTLEANEVETGATTISADPSDGW